MKVNAQNIFKPLQAVAVVIGIANEMPVYVVCCRCTES
jgi:hypothetical protein